jgi:DNA-binding MarR family transcriptional regulator
MYGLRVPTRRRVTFDPIAEATRQWDERFGRSLPMTTVISLMRAHQLVQAGVDACLLPFGLSFARYEALVLLSFTRQGRLPMNKMGERLMIHPTSVTNIVDRLEQDGLVIRAENPADRRSRLVEITSVGRSTAEQATQALNTAEFGLAAMPDRDLQALVGILRRLRLNSGDLQTQ